MSTRSLTIFQDGGKEIAVLYRHSDGYPSGHGRELAEFLAGFTITDGIVERRPELANGMGCLAAWVVARFKTQTGEFYLMPAGTRDTGEEYRYTVYQGATNAPQIRAEAVNSFGLLLQGVDLLFDGPARAMLAWIDGMEQAEISTPQPHEHAVGAAVWYWDQDSAWNTWRPAVVEELGYKDGWPVYDVSPTDGKLPSVTRWGWGWQVLPRVDDVAPAPPDLALTYP